MGGIQKSAGAIEKRIIPIKTFFKIICSYGQKKPQPNIWKTAKSKLSLINNMTIS